MNKSKLPGHVSDDKFIIEDRYIDNFGNLVSNISQKPLRRWRATVVLKLCYAISDKKLSTGYTPAQAGSLLAFFNSQGLLEVALAEARGKIFNGANSMLGVEVQNTITITFQ